jgi:DNA-binding response OmpR family regulator
MKTVLIVESSKNIAMMIEKCLTNNGFKVEKADDGVEALVKLFNIYPDIIILEVVLSKLSGTMLCEAVRQNEKLSKSLVIAIGSGIHQEEIKEVLEAGADEYLSKPFKARELIETINREFINKR